MWITLLARRLLLTYLHIVTLCLSEEGSETEDESLLEQQQQQQQQRRTRRKRRQRLDGVSDEDASQCSSVATEPPSYSESSAQACPAQAGVESEKATCTSSDQAEVEPHPHISPVPELNSQAISDHEELEFQGQAIQDLATDHEELEPQGQAIPGHGPIPATVRSEPVAAGSVIVVHATVERQPPSSPDHSWWKYHFVMVFWTVALPDLDTWRPLGLLQ